MERVDWGECEEDGEKNRLLTAFIHHPTGVTVWLCSDHAPAAKDALDRKQVPGLLGDRLQAYLDTPR